VVGEGEVDIDNGLFYCYACWLIYHAARARLRRDTAHVQTARTFQGVSSALGSAQHEQSVQDVSFASGRRPQLQRLGACTERCTVQNASSVFEQRAQRACTQITTRAAHAHDLEAELIQVGGWDSSSDSEGGRAVEGSEEHFDESEHVGDLAEEERSTDGEDGFGEEMDETRASEREGCRSSEGSDFESKNEGEDGRGPEGSDLAAEEGHEEVWDEVQEPLSTMEHEEFDATAEAAQASRPSSASSQASVRS
jgi:hypothetical protein